ncbi:hypothetical protein MMC25_008024 [Agyrium rufum]|nr:hypothetical protein [Agyrium rufum]
MVRPVDTIADPSGDEPGSLAAGTNGVAQGGEQGPSQALHGDMPKKARSSNSQLLNMTQARYAVLGGFVVNSSEFWGKKQVTLTAKSFCELYQLGKLIPPTEDEIRHSNPTSLSSKIVTLGGFVCLSLQYISRLANSLPFTLVEIYWLPQAVIVISPTKCDGELQSLVALYLLPDYFALQTAYGQADLPVNIGELEVGKHLPLGSKGKKLRYFALTGYQIYKDKGRDFKWKPQRRTEARFPK